MSTLVSLLRLLLPRRCVACRRPGEWMCDGCGPQMRALAAPLCGRCGAPDAARGARMSRLQAPALAHDGTLRALARRPGVPSSSRAGSAATSRPGAWPARSSRTSFRGLPSMRSCPCPPRASASCAAVQTLRPSSHRSWRAGGTCRSPRCSGARAASVPSAGSMPARADRTCAARSRHAQALRGSRSSTTCTRPGRRSTSAPERCARRARGRCTWSRSRELPSIGPLRRRPLMADSHYDVPERGGTRCSFR